MKVLELEGDDAQTYFGTFEFRKQEIRLRPEFASEALKADTLIHEILHAVWKTQGIKAKREETIVNALSTGFTQVLKDNPDLRKYLNEALK
jgi:hypothetical protein